MKISIFGDLCVTESNIDKFEKGEVKYLFNNICEVLKESDISIVNLECPLTDGKNKLPKSGPNLKASIKSISGIKKSGFDIVSIANNHIMDYMDVGLFDTIDVCEANEILTIGANENSQKAKKPIVKKIGNKKLGVLSFADHEFEIADENNAGTNGLDLLYSFDYIKEVKQKCDYLVILYHSGLEHYPYPSPDLQRRCRKMVECGADFVICQHSHCIGAIEEYQGSQILYGQGNFLFATDNKSDTWNTGVIVQIKLFDDTWSFDLLPTKVVDNKVELLQGDEKTKVLKVIQEYSVKIKNQEFLINEWEKFCKSRITQYWGILMGFPRIFYIVNKLFNNILINIIIPKNRRRTILNIIRCESHLEALKSILEFEIKKRDKI